MPTYRIGSVFVTFPHKAYDCQLDYMKKVVEALDGKANALLESPTGTGKTLCLLCATIAWLEKENRKGKKRKKTPGEEERESSGDEDSSSDSIRTIVYASRTHSQLAKVVKELRNTSYKPKTCVLGSRQQLCIHPRVKSLKGGAQNQACKALIKKGLELEEGCSAYHGVQRWVDRNKKEARCEILDIEDLVKIGQSERTCPFFLSKELQNDAELVILPYNYLVDPKIRKSMTTLDWSKCTLIFDEAHNLERVCTDAASFDLSSVKLSQCIGEVQQAIEFMLERLGLYQNGFGDGDGNGEDLAVASESLRVTKTILCNLEKAIASHELPPNGQGLTFPGDYIFKLLASVEVTADKFDMFVQQLREVKEILQEKDEGIKSYNISTLIEDIKIVQRSMGTIAPGDSPLFEGYRVHIASSPPKDSQTFQLNQRNNFKSMPTLSYWCFLPGIAMRELANLGVESIIVTSGTLSPLPSFSHELQLPFNVSIENPHVIDADQVWVGILPVGPSNIRLNSSYRNRDVLEYKNDLGNAIANFARVIPDGLLVFFPSFAVMNTCIRTWQTPGANGTTIWEHIMRYKKPIVEPRENRLFAQAAEDFKSKLDDPKFSGAVFFGVCRGKASEGLDFSDKAGRGVIITGIPFAMKTDPKVRIKKDMLDEACRSSNHSTGRLSKLSGDQWYRQQASRAVNQAIGRVIRHRHDYGAILLCDERFLGKGAQEDLSKWLRPHINAFNSFGSAAASLTRFYKERMKATKRVMADTTNIKEAEEVSVVVGGAPNRVAGSSSRQNMLDVLALATSLRQVAGESKKREVPSKLSEKLKKIFK